jgi:hypothetical protein
MSVFNSVAGPIEKFLDDRFDQLIALGHSLEEGISGLLAGRNILPQFSSLL